VNDTAMHEAFQRQHRASRAQPASDAPTRRALLSALKDLILDNREALAEAISQDFGGRARPETELLEIVPAIRGVDHARKSLGRLMKADRRAVDIVFQPARAWVRYEPLGIIAPWNYPLLLALSPLTDAIAAGNRAMIKPSELTPAFSALLARLVSELFDPAQVTVVTGGVETAKAFSALPFDHLLFTGSTTVGRHVMRAAAENLTPVTLELGGKSPAIVAPDYSTIKAARSIAFGKFVNAGQTCIAPDYALAPAAKARIFAEAVLAHAARAYPTIAGNADYSAIITSHHRERLRAAIEEARAAGATILTHGDPGGDPAKIAPTIVLDAPADGVLMTEEIFGPVLPVVGYRDLDQAIAYVQERERPLALYCFTDDHRTQARVLDGAMSGGVTLNGTLLHIAQESLPFGGIGPSGMGAYHGQEGFRRFSHARAVHRIGPINAFEKMGPPWGVLARTTARLLARK
jgi:coniferyl-aldehyde dehydrogenase